MRSLALAFVAFVVALAACAGEPPASCGALGRVEACPCPGGVQGAQECGPLGVWSACVCPGADAGTDAPGDAPSPPVDGPAAPEAGADVPEAAADAPAPLDGPREAAADAAPDGPLVCSASRADCDRSAGNGCEVDTAADPVNCGACGRRCALEHVDRPACVGGACAVAACAPSFADCDRNPTNGCEVNIRESLGDCGGCGMRCEGVNVAVSCASGTCVRGACLPGFADCDGEPANGCEVDPRVSRDHCGRCNNPCDGARVCAAGRCVTP